MVYLASERGTANAALSGAVVIPSVRGVANATLSDPDPEDPYRASRRAVANATLGNPAPYPPEWHQISTWQAPSSTFLPISLRTAGSILKVLQYNPSPVVNPGFAASNRGTANAVVGTWFKPKVGVIGSSESTFNTINNQIGQGTIRRTYNTTLPASWAASTAASDVAAGRESLWSWKPSVTGFPTSSSQQNAFSNFLDTIPSGHKCVIMAWHEPENDIDAGDYTLAQWGALQNSINTIIKSKNRPEIRTGFCLMGPWTFDTRSGRVGWNWAGALNWSLVDVVGIDPYRTTAGSTMSLQTMLTVRNSGSGTGTAPSMMDVLKSWGKPVSIMEWGAYNSTEASVATFITQAYDWMKQWNQVETVTPIESCLWYNMTLIGADTPLTGVEVTAYASIVADSKIPVS